MNSVRIDRRCLDCRSRKLFRPVVKTLDDLVHFVCRDCWEEYEDAAFMFPQPTADDQRALHKARAS